MINKTKGIIYVAISLVSMVLIVLFFLKSDIHKADFLPTLVFLVSGFLPALLLDKGLTTLSIKNIDLPTSDNAKVPNIKRRRIVINIIFLPIIAFLLMFALFGGFAGGWGAVALMGFLIPIGVLYILSLFFFSSRVSSSRVRSPSRFILILVLFTIIAQIGTSLYQELKREKERELRDLYKTHIEGLDIGSDLSELRIEKLINTPYSFWVVSKDSLKKEAPSGWPNKMYEIVTALEECGDKVHLYKRNMTVFFYLDNKLVYKHYDYYLHRDLAVKHSDLFVLSPSVRVCNTHFGIDYLGFWKEQAYIYSHAHAR